MRGSRAIKPKHIMTKEEKEQRAARYVKAVDMVLNDRPAVTKITTSSDDDLEDIIFGDDDFNDFDAAPDEVAPPKIDQRREMKKCRKCGRVLPIDEFNKHCRTKDGHFNICKKCYGEVRYKFPHEGKLSQNGAPGRTASTAVGMITEWADSELAEELRRRGYRGALVKEIELAV